MTTGVPRRRRMILNRRGRAAMLLTVTALVGCGQRPPAPTVAPAPPPPVAARSLDGAYQGTATRYRADRRTCPPPGLVYLAVNQNAFDYSLGRRGSVPVTIGPGGTFRGSDGDFEITGTADGTRLRGHADSAACGYEFVAVRKR